MLTDSLSKSPFTHSSSASETACHVVASNTKAGTTCGSPKVCDCVRHHSTHCQADRGKSHQGTGHLDLSVMVGTAIFIPVAYKGDLFTLIRLGWESRRPMLQAPSLRDQSLRPYSARNRSSELLFQHLTRTGSYHAIT